MRRRYRSYRYAAPRPGKSRPRPKTPARIAYEDRLFFRQLLFGARVALSLGFLFTVRTAVAEAQDGFLWQASFYGALASCCLVIATCLRFPSVEPPPDGLRPRDRDDD